MRFYLIDEEGKKSVIAYEDTRPKDHGKYGRAKVVSKDGLFNGIDIYAPDVAGRLKRWLANNAKNFEDYEYLEPEEDVEFNLDAKDVKVTLLAAEYVVINRALQGMLEYDDCVWSGWGLEAAIAAAKDVYLIEHEICYVTFADGFGEEVLFETPEELRIRYEEDLQKAYDLGYHLQLVSLKYDNAIGYIAEIESKEISAYCILPACWGEIEFDLDTQDEVVTLLESFGVDCARCHTKRTLSGGKKR